MAWKHYDYTMAGYVVLVAVVVTAFVLAGSFLTGQWFPEKSEPVAWGVKHERTVTIKAAPRMQREALMTVKSDCDVPSTHEKLIAIANQDAETKKRLEDLRKAYLDHKAQVDFLLERSQALHDQVCCPNAPKELW